jgi:hypothetical protein
MGLSHVNGYLAQVDGKDEVFAHTLEAAKLALSGLLKSGKPLRIVGNSEPAPAREWHFDPVIMQWIERTN